MKPFPGRISIAAIAPAGRVQAGIVQAGADALAALHMPVQVMPHALSGSRLPYLAAEDSCRAADLENAWLDEKFSLLWCIRGGYGSARLLDRLDWEKLALRDMPVAGFSDITALHWAMIAKNAGTALTMPMFSYLPDADETTWKHLRAALTGEVCHFQLPALRDGRISGLPLAGNLTVAASLCGTPYFPDGTGKVIILEEVGEKSPYRLDRLLNQLLMAGLFSRCAGVVFGNFTDCGGMDAVMEVLKDFTGRIACPVFYGLPFGHQLPFISFNSRAELSFSGGTLEI